MITELVPSSAGVPAARTVFILPAVIADQGDKAAEPFFTFFIDTVR